MTSEAGIEVARNWNRFVQSLVRARDLWDKLQRDLEEDPVHGDDLPPKVQKYLSMFKRMQFTTALPDLADHWRAYGGLESFFVELPEDAELKEKYNEIVEPLREENTNDRA